MAGLKELRVRIKTIKSTQQITRAMKMVASAKLKRAETQALKYRNFLKKIEDLTISLTARCDVREHFLLGANNSSVEGLIVVTSDRGLCGAFNSLLLKSVVQHIKDLQAENKKCKIWVIGRKGSSFLGKLKYQVEKSFVGIYRNLDIKVADNIGREMIEQYKNNEIGKITIVYNHYKSILRQIITYKNIIPFSENINKQNKKAVEDGIDYIYEPSVISILNQLLPMYLSSVIYSSLLESQVGELASRMTAMENATNNCVERMNMLTILYNRMRQAAITKEISEIVGGASALEQ